MIGQSINRCGVALEFPHYGMVSSSVSARFLYGFPYRFQRSWTVLWSTKHLQDVVGVGEWNNLEFIKQLLPMSPFSPTRRSIIPSILVKLTWAPSCSERSEVISIATTSCTMETWMESRPIRDFSTAGGLLPDGETAEKGGGRFNSLALGNLN